MFPVNGSEELFPSIPILRFPVAEPKVVVLVTEVTIFELAYKVIVDPTRERTTLIRV